MSDDRLIGLGVEYDAPKKSKNAISKDVALAEYESLCEEYRLPNVDNKDLFVYLIEKGRLELDRDKSEIVYKLERPVRNLNNGMLTEIRLRRPKAKDMYDISRKKKNQVKISRTQSVEVDYSPEKEALDNMFSVLTVLGGIPDGVSMEIDYSDVENLIAVASFLS
jgi:hypothetical protein